MKTQLILSEKFSSKTELERKQAVQNKVDLFIKGHIKYRNNSKKSLKLHR